MLYSVASDQGLHWLPLIQQFVDKLTGGKVDFSQFNSFPTCGNFYRLLITFANSLDPDQAPVWPSDGIPERLLKKLILKKYPQMTKNMQNYPAYSEKFFV